MNSRLSASAHPALSMQLLAGCVLALTSATSWAANGLSVTGYGAESSAWAGVDIAIAKDYTALNTNPAGMAQQTGRAFDVFLTPFYSRNQHSDQYNGKRTVNKPFGAISGIGYLQPLFDGSVVAGIGLFGQGGTGYNYLKLHTPYGNEDDLSALFGIFKIAPGVAWRVNDQLRVGASLGITYAAVRQKFFADTSVYDPNDASKTFFGSRFDGGKTTAFNGKFGLQYQATEALTLALTYTSKTPLNLKDGTLTVNYEALGMGRVRYDKASQSGLAIGEEFGAGLLYRVTPRWRVGTKLLRINHTGALRASTLMASEPNAPAPVNEIVSVSPLHFRDQTVIGIGSDFALDDKTTLRAGWSHTRQPIPSSTLNPLFALVNEDLVAAGFARKLGAEWTFAMTGEYQLASKQVADNPNLPFGKGFDTNGGAIVTLMMSRRW